MHEYLDQLVQVLLIVQIIRYRWFKIDVLLMNRLNLAGNDKQIYDNFQILNVLDLVHVDLFQVEIELIEFLLNDLIN